MPIRIEFLPLESGTTIAAPPNPAQPTPYALTELPEIAHLYGGSIASTSVMSPALLEAPASSPDPAQPPDPSGRWSTSLQTILDRPPAAFPSRLVAGGVVFCAACVAWATTSQVEEIGRAQGRLVPQGDAYKVHPVVSGKIAQVYVKEGQTVKAGQVIAELDNELARNRVEALRQEHRSYEKERLQIDALIDKTRLEAETRSTITTAEIRAQEATIAQAQAKLQGQDTTILQTQERATTSQMLLAQLQADADSQKERIERLRFLVEQGALAREQLYQAEQHFGDRQRTITQQTGDIQQALAESQKMRSDLEQVVAEARRLRAQLAQKYAEGKTAQIQAQQTIQNLLVQRTQLVAKQQHNEKLIQQANAEMNQLLLKAPIDGTVTTLNIRNRGEVIQTGQTVTEIAPKTAPLVLMAALPTREAGFVQVGDKVQVKFDAYPYQDYGIVEGQVVKLSPDVKVDERLGAVYRVEVVLDRHTVGNAAQTAKLKAGQTATAEIIVRRRTIAEMLLDPIRQLQKGGISL